MILAITDKFRKTESENFKWNQLLAEAAHNAGVITDEEFAIFQNSGYMGLYGGLTVAATRKKG